MSIDAFYRNRNRFNSMLKRISCASKAAFPYGGVHAYKSYEPLAYTRLESNLVMTVNAMLQLLPNVISL